MRVGWDDVLAEIGGKLSEIRRRHGPHAIGVYLGNPVAFNYAFTVLGTAFVRALGTRNYFSAASLDCNNKFVVSKTMLGSPATHPVPDLDRARFALLIGTNPSVSQSSFINAPRMVERLKSIEARGGRVVIVDPRRTETARSVGHWVPIVPDTDAALLLGLLHVIFGERLERSDVLERHAVGLPALREAVLPFSPERVSKLTGIDAREIATLARDFARARRRLLPHFDRGQSGHLRRHRLRRQDRARACDRQSGSRGRRAVAARRARSLGLGLAARLGSRTRLAEQNRRLSAGAADAAHRDPRRRNPDPRRRSDSRSDCGRRKSGAQRPGRRTSARRARSARALRQRGSVRQRHRRARDASVAGHGLART